MTRYKNSVKWQANKLSFHSKLNMYCLFKLDSAIKYYLLNMHFIISFSFKKFYTLFDAESSENMLHVLPM